MKKFALTALACLTLASAAGCDDQLLGKGTPSGELCEIQVDPVAECGDGTMAFCSVLTSGEPAEYGECLAQEEIVCMPGDRKNLGPHGDEWTQEVCGNRFAACKIYDGVPVWEEQYCETPLVLSFDGGPVEFIEAEATPMATFDITMQAGSCITTDWPSAATPWLALDRDGDGHISGGHELFGTGTRLDAGAHPGVHAANGFAALAELDANGDGIIDAQDPRFGELLLWRDHDADRSSTPGELSPLSESGVQALPVAGAGSADCDERGNCAALGGQVQTAAGTGRLMDVYLSCH